ncbi:simple sugar transport system permease protein [Palleronia aestuarii]|uniref:Simple sugar transport system permease protein n=1 Tax=Palleronia aestuarii TaxID=568105 RepID=A0A2W7N1B5_9RHOB|nr:ABC transporter permease [Palleronia aestuarii]PZX13771.1 simple sugar transport system permease protein [Palleronia aestuarii]
MSNVQLDATRRSGGWTALRPSGESLALLAVLALLVVLFSALTDRFLTGATFASIAFQLPELGLLTLAMMIPLLSGGLNLAVTFSANLSGLVLAWTLTWLGGADAGLGAMILGMALAILAGAAIGWVLGMVVAYTGAHPILASLAMMIFLRGLGEFLTRGASISGFPPALIAIGQGTFLGIPAPLLVFLGAIGVWALILNRTRLGFTIYMLGSNPDASRYSGVNTRRALVMVYLLSSVMCAVAGIVMAARFNSVRVGHGEAYLLITVLACFLGRVDPFGGFGRIAPVVLALVILQVIGSGLNLLGTNQHLATALWGGILIVVMGLRYLWGRYGQALFRSVSS